MSPGTMLGQAAEGALVVLARAGDDAAFGELVRRRQAWLRRLLRRLCRDHGLVDDLAQQAFLQAWRSLPALRSAAAFGPWLRRLAVTAWLQHLRRAPLPTLSADALDSFESSDSVDSPGASAGAGATPGGVGERLDLDAALARLPDDVRLCIVLAYSEGMSHGEISAATGLPLGTVKSHIRRGAEQLRALLRAYRAREELA
ncbi:MAG TPA: sigma-70 family RNA polymerase sigma factor [Steroidobacteraceae bacterium]|jgi:RNA polymerase sigma-70 factor (ECF subfamily)|nr:sigma-70 family RNA polymerase sigma factor [Steroidobacteraceae bacterium]